MKKSTRRKTKPAPAKVTAPDIAAATGREYRDIAESALATAMPDATPAEITDHYRRVAALTTNIGKQLETQRNAFIRGAIAAEGLLNLAKRDRKVRTECYDAT